MAIPTQIHAWNSDQSFRKINYYGEKASQIIMCLVYILIFAFLKYWVG